jgi:pimeloyl-ACP methyl ester carboxylesterase
MSANGGTATVELPQGTVAYREVGTGEPIVFVHGILVNGRIWDRVAERLAPDFRCFVVDWPMGSHRSAMNADADLSPPGQAEIVLAFMDALGLERATFVGNDSGGAVSQILTAAHPERVERLVLTNCDTYEHFPPFPFSLMSPVARMPGGMGFLAAPFRFGPVRRGVYSVLAKERIPPRLVDEWLAALGNPDVTRDARKLIVGADKRQTIAAAEGLAHFERPVRFAWGTDDRFFKLAHAERLAAAVPDGRVEPIPGAGTFSPLDQPERVAELVAQFMREPTGVSARAD